MVFGPLRNGCLRWGSSVEPGRVPIQVLNTHYSYLARIVSESNVLLGKFNSNSEKFWANREGIFIEPIYTTDQEIEILTNDEACSLPWLAYTVGETLSDESVAGGRLADGSPTYVAKIILSDRIRLGYYNPKSKFAFYKVNKEAHTSTSMDMLVLI